MKKPVASTFGTNPNPSCAVCVWNSPLFVLARSSLYSNVPTSPSCWDSSVLRSLGRTVFDNRLIWLLDTATAVEVSIGLPSHRFIVALTMGFLGGSSGYVGVWLDYWVALEIESFEAGTSGSTFSKAYSCFWKTMSSSSSFCFTLTTTTSSSASSSSAAVHRHDVWGWYSSNGVVLASVGRWHECESPVRYVFYGLLLRCNIQNLSAASLSG